jgi:hypothetical protein
MTSTNWSAQTGQPFTVTLSVDPTASGATAHPDRLRDGALPGDQRSVGRWFDTTAFVTPSCPCFGNSGRGILAGPAFANIDISVAREFHFTERMRPQLRSEAFNLFNHPNLGLPARAIGGAGLGVIGSVVNNERQIQMALKLY